MLLLYVRTLNVLQIIIYLLKHIFQTHTHTHSSALWQKTFWCRIDEKYWIGNFYKQKMDAGFSLEHKKRSTWNLMFLNTTASVVRGCSENLLCKQVNILLNCFSMIRHFNRFNSVIYCISVPNRDFI